MNENTKSNKKRIGRSEKHINKSEPQIVENIHSSLNKEEPQVIQQHKTSALVDRRLVQVPSNFIEGRPKAALLFWLFVDFRCGVLLFFVILVMYINIKICKNRCQMLD